MFNPQYLWKVHDASGLDIYLNECRKWKVVPNTQITRQLGSYQLQLRHNYLKLAEVSALTSALKVWMANRIGLANAENFH